MGSTRPQHHRFPERALPSRLNIVAAPRRPTRRVTSATTVRIAHSGAWCLRPPPRRLQGRAHFAHRLCGPDSNQAFTVRQFTSSVRCLGPPTTSHPPRNCDSNAMFQKVIHVTHVLSLKTRGTRWAPDSRARSRLATQLTRRLYILLVIK